MTTRPTIEGLAAATYSLESLADRCDGKNDNSYHLIADILDMAHFLDTETELSRKAAYSTATGGGEIHPLGAGGGSPVEGRIGWGTESGQGQRGGQMQPPIEPSDPEYRLLAKLKREFRAELTSFANRWTHRIREESGYPHRSQDVGQTG